MRSWLIKKALAFIGSYNVLNMACQSAESPRNWLSSSVAACRVVWRLPLPTAARHSLGVGPETNGDNGIQIIMFDTAADLSLAVSANY